MAVVVQAGGEAAMAAFGRGPTSDILLGVGVLVGVDRAKILDRVSKLLRMARGRANEHESAVAAAMAERLMREHQIEQSQMILDELAEGEGLGCEDAGAWRRCPDWQGLLGVAIARLFDCEVDRCEHPSRPGLETLRFYGYAADTIVATWTFGYLVDEVCRRFNLYCESSELSLDSRHEALRDYRLGAVHSLLQTLGEATEAKRSRREIADPEGECSALIARSKEAAIGDAFGRFTYRPRPLAERGAVAFVHGRRDGRLIKLHRSVPVARAASEA